MPWRTAPAWPDSPPPNTFTLMSNVWAWLVSSSGWRTIMRPVSREKKMSTGLSFTVMLPLPGLMKTRATAFLRRPVPSLYLPIMVVASLDLERLRLLRRVRMLGAGVDLELLDHRVAKPRLGEHAHHRQ